MAIVASVPAAAYLSAALGDTYKVRATVYCILLLWSVIGATLIFIVTRSSKQKPFTLGRAFLWFISAWLWPLLMGVWLFQHNRKR